jgi:hypothetical protein
LPSCLVQHLIDAGEEHGIEGKGCGLASVAAEPYGDTNVVEATRGNERQISVLYPAPPGALVRFGFQAIAQIDATPEVRERAGCLSGDERLDPIRATRRHRRHDRSFDSVRARSPAWSVGDIVALRHVYRFPRN